jgi:hypothetical protein
MDAPLSPRSRRAQSFDQTIHQVNGKKARDPWNTTEQNAVARNVPSGQVLDVSWNGYAHIVDASLRRVALPAAAALG